MTVQRVTATISLTLALAAVPSIHAQSGANIYITQFRGLRSQLATLAPKADALAEHGTSEQKSVYAQDIFALQKLIHRLGEEAAGTNLNVVHPSGRDDKSLLLVVVGAEAMSLQCTALDAYVTTGDRTFKAAARDADLIAANIDKSM
jgi:hypothetical protein